ncbi:hypothetical protein Droror1_Dr00014433 [Drosera rotundifolia]
MLECSIICSTLIRFAKTRRTDKFDSRKPEELWEYSAEESQANFCQAWRGVRLWKPMVEEMYKEEFGEGDINFKSSPESTPKRAPEKSWASQDKREDQSETSMATTDHQPSQRHDSRLNTNHGVVMSGTTERQLQFNPHGDDAKNYGFMRLPDDHYNGEGSLMMAAAAGYQVSELGCFTVDNQVSLALGLHNGKPDATVGSTTTESINIDPVNQQYRFVN